MANVLKYLVNLLIFNCIMLSDHPTGYPDTSCKSNICITTLNTHGAMTNGIYISTLMQYCDILCLQEHYLYPDMHGFLKTIDGNIDGYIKSDNSLDVNDFPRKHKGGIAILWKNDISYVITPLHTLGTDRIMVIKIHNIQHQHLYVINVYTPSSNYTVAEYDAVLSELFEVVMYCSDRGRAVVLGDMNGQIGPSGGSRYPMPQSHRGRRLLGIHEWTRSRFTGCTPSVQGTCGHLHWVWRPEWHSNWPHMLA